MLKNSKLKLKFKPAELQYFNWLFNVSPCFPVSSAKIKVITDPRAFYDRLCHQFQNASNRISMASLYIGTGDMEKNLLQVTKKNILDNQNVKFNVLLDYQRGTRGDVNSKMLLQEFVDDIPDRCSVYMYQTPKLQGAWARVVPARYNELVALQHMKLYIADDTVLLSGANCSNDYFLQRQDRYVEIQDENLADFYCELIGIVNSFSKECCKDGIKSTSIPKEEFIRNMRLEIATFINKWKEKQASRSDDDPEVNSWVFPLVQMGEYNINQDEVTTQRLIESAPQLSQLRLATGYFNLTEQYSKTLLDRSKANISLLMAHPNANGFLGASGPAGGIPHAYSLIARQFWNRVSNSSQCGRIKLLEYERPQWTFHAKGLWYYPSGSQLPWGTVIGSANLGERSVRRDLEAQAAIFTVSPDLQQEFHHECVELHKYSTECSNDLLERRIPLWVHATVGLFRTFF